MDNDLDRKIDVTTILFLLVQNRQQTHDWTLIGSGVYGLGIQEWSDTYKVVSSVGMFMYDHKIWTPQAIILGGFTGMFSAWFKSFKLSGLTLQPFLHFQKLERS